MLAITELSLESRPCFHLATRASSYVLRVNPAGHLEGVHLGDPLPGLDEATAAALITRWPITPGMVVVDDEARDPDYGIGRTRLEWSSLGRGDYRDPAVEVVGRPVLDFRYRSHTVAPGVRPCEDGLPGAAASEGAETLAIELADAVARLAVTLTYTVHPELGVVTRRATLANEGDEPAIVDRLLSATLDLPNLGLDVITLDGEWLRETHAHRRPLVAGRIVNAALTGASGNEHNPAVALCERGATETTGRCHGFNLVYSGNHYTSVELCAPDTVRVATGINPSGFDWELGPGERLEAPEAVLAFSADGLGGMSRLMHRFVARCIVRGPWADRERPVVVNNWEGTGFRFDHDAVVAMAERAKRMGADMFVLDDGWFGKRHDDTSSLGDWVPNSAKLPQGVAGLGRAVKDLGLDFGLWFEPECVSPDSDLYRAHPDWAIAAPGRPPALGRHQLLLDLANPAVRDHLVETVGGILDAAPIDYVKWDMNRRLSDAHSPTCRPGEVAHRQVLGLYDVLRRVFGPRPDILLESCSAGGNRFDLGMLCFSPQIWTSDCTDPVERIDIQLGASLFYPQSTMSAHVARQVGLVTGRITPLGTRFAVAALGVLGYELDPRALSGTEIDEIAGQVAWYRERRRLLQFGDWRRVTSPKPHVAQVVIGDAEHCVAVHLRTLVPAAAVGDRLVVPGLDADARYTVSLLGAEFAATGAALGYGLPIPYLHGDFTALVADIRRA